MRTKIKLDGIERAQAQTLPTCCSGDGVSVEVWLSFRGKEMGEGGGSGLDHAWSHPKQTVGSGFILWAGEACPRLLTVLTPTLSLPRCPHSLLPPGFAGRGHFWSQALLALAGASEVSTCSELCQAPADVRFRGCG